MFSKHNKWEDDIYGVNGMKTMENSENIVTDPFGMYTGNPENPDERPIQDADDL